MGQHKAKAPKVSVTWEPITPLIMQRLVAAVADIKSTRLKIIAGRHSKQDIISVIEPLCRMNLLQIGVVMNNIAAVQFLMSIGASKDVLWDPLDGVKESWGLSYCMPDRVFFDFQQISMNLAAPNIAQDTFQHSGFTLLHIAALVGHKEMVRFLVEQAGIPVDVRAAVTGATPLMTVITRRCVTELGLKGPVTHVCCFPTSHEEASDMTCKPVLPIAQLLLELGADLGAVDNSGACLLATAAEAGSCGMLDDLLLHVPQVLDCCPKHAGHLLYGIVSNWVRNGTVDELLKDLFKLVKNRNTDVSRSRQFWKEIAAPINRRKSAVIDETLKVLPGNELEVTRALCRIMYDKSSNRYSAIKFLISEGVPISALRLGQQHYTVTGHCDPEMLMIIVDALSEVHGQKCTEQHYDLLFGLWADAFLCPHPELLAPRLDMLEKCAAFFHGTGKISDQSLWPKRFSPELCERYDFCAVGKPVSQLVLAAAGSVPAAVHSFIYMYVRSRPADEELPNPSLQAFINRPDPCGRLPLIEAIVRNRAGDVHQLLACGADLTVADGLGRMALHEIASLGTPAREMGLMCLSYLPSEDSEMRSRVLNRVATLAPNQHKVTLAQMIVYSQAWYMLPQLVQLGLDVHWAPDGESRGKVMLSPDYVDPAFLTGPSLPAALTAVDETARLSPLGMALGRGSWKWFKPLLDACRQEGVDPNDLLRWHERTPSEAPLALPVLFIALMQQGEALKQLMDAGFDLGPHINHCIPVRLHCSYGNTGEDGILVWNVEEEKCSLLIWAAAFGQLGAVKALLNLGMDPNFQLARGGAWMPTAISAALDQPGSLPDLINSPEVPFDHKSLCDGGQLECILELLQWKAAITQDQLRQILQMMDKAHSSKVARELWAFLRNVAAACAACGLIGDWRTCARCKAAFYCSRTCQRSHWLKHRGTCQQRLLDNTLREAAACRPEA